MPGPLTWIHEGQVDIVADMMIPADNDESLAKVMADFYDRLEATVTSNRFHSAADIAGRADEPEAEEDKRFLVTDLRLHLNNVRAVVPIFTRDLSYINNALIRPIVAYINSRRTFIPVNCRLVKRAGDFNGSWTIYDSGLMDDLSAAVRLLSPCVRTSTNCIYSGLRRICAGRSRRTSAQATVQEGRVLVAATGGPGDLHQHGREYRVTR